MPRDKKRKLPHRRSKNPSKPPRRKRTRSKKRPISRRTPRTQARTRKIHRRKPTRVRTRKKRPTAVRVRRVESRTIRIPQDTERQKDGTQFGRQQLIYKFSGNKVRNSEKGLARLSSLYSKIRKNRRDGKTFQETLWLRVRYKGKRGKYKIRTVPVTGKNFRDIQANINALHDGFEYDQYGEQGEFKKSHKRDSFSIVGMKYERIALLKAIKKKK